MLKYILLRLVQGVLVVFAGSVLIFSLVHLMPGDPVELITGERVSEERRQEFRVRLGLDQPPHIQYINWLRRAVNLDFGTSIRTRRPVMDILEHRIPLSVRLAGLAMAAQLVIGVPLGLIAAYKKDGAVDRGLISLASLLQAMPNFWVAMILIIIFGAILQWLPLNGSDTWRHFILPVTALSLGGIGGTLRMTRAEVLEVFREKYITTAYAKGLREKVVIIKHVLRNSLILVMITIFMSLPWIISGSIIIENVFQIPGMGSILTQSILSQDFPVIQASILIIAVLTVLCNIASDIVAAALDPRIRIEITGGAAN